MRSFLPDGDARDTAAAGGSADRDLFVTETMAELSARQGRTTDAVAIYRRLLAGHPAPDRRARWETRLAALEATVPAASVTAGPASASAAQARAAAPAEASGAPAESPTGPLLQLPLLIRTPVRSGQIVYAEGRDLIVLAPVNPGAQLMADGHIHVYAPLRGRAVAGVRGCAGAQIFCQRLEAELVGIDAAYIPAEELPADLLGRPARIWLEAGVCRLGNL
jgi:septum site-determining protein MinC